jgi:hypothetical protein
MSTITVTLRDEQGRLSTKSIHLAASVTTVAAAQGALDDFLTAWPAVSDAGVSDANVTFPLTMTPIDAVTGSNLDEAARVRLLMATGVGNESYRIPCPAKTGGVFDYITGGAVDAADAGIVAFFALFATGDVLRIGVNSLRAVTSVVSGYLEKR